MKSKEFMSKPESETWVQTLFKMGLSHEQIYDLVSKLLLWER